MRLGEILVEQGILSHLQVDEILETQREAGRPFGLLAEQMFGVSPEAIEEAWAVQYGRLAEKIDLGSIQFDDGVEDLITRRQAWQFRSLPLYFEGDELVIATTSRDLRRAMRFATRILGMPGYFVLAEPNALGEHLCRRYPMSGMSPASLSDGSGLDQYLATLIG